MKVPAGLSVLVLVTLFLGCNPPSASAAGSFMVFDSRQVVPRNMINVEFYSKRLQADFVIGAQFIVNVSSGVNRVYIVCFSEKWDRETVQKAAIALASHMERDDEIDPVPLLTSLGLKGCQKTDG